MDHKLITLLVHGYVRNIQHNSEIVNSNSHTVLDIYNLVQSFHCQSDVWNVELSSNTFKIMGQYLKLIQNVGFYNQYFNAFGGHTIRKGQKKIWRVKICQLDERFWAPTVSLAIGIIDYSKISDVMNGNFYNELYEGYAYIAANGWLKHRSITKPIQTYATVCRQNGIIKMELDMASTQNCTLKYCINGKDYGFVFEHIESDNKEYVMAVSMWKSDTIQLIE
eukprot:393861_1